MSLIPQVSLFNFIHTYRIKYKKILSKNPSSEIKGVYLDFDIFQMLQSYKSLVPCPCYPHSNTRLVNSLELHTWEGCLLPSQPKESSPPLQVTNTDGKPARLSFSNSFLKWYEVCVLHPLGLQWWTKAAFSVWVFDLKWRRFLFQAYNFIRS